MSSFRGATEAKPLWPTPSWNHGAAIQPRDNLESSSTPSSRIDVWIGRLTNKKSWKGLLEEEKIRKPRHAPAKVASQLCL
jgi:hypothetical protein